MADKTLKARIKLLYKTWAEWNENLSFVPLQGEMCVVAIPAEAGVSQKEPAILVKIGDGATDFEHLPWLQAIASDVHDWAKKDALDFADLSEDFKAALASYVGAGNEYRLNKNGEVYTLQVRQYDAGAGDWGEWSDVENSAIDISNKTDAVVSGPNGTARIFNERDGGGAKFEHNDGTWSFVGVNDGGENGLAGQIYTVKQENGKYVGTRINMTKDGFFYLANRDSSAYTAADEIATKGDVEGAVASLGAALHYIGMTTLADGETIEHALGRVVSNYQVNHSTYELTAGAVAIVGAGEFIYDGSDWDEFGDTGLYETIASAEAAHEALQQAIANEVNARAEADNTLRADINKRTLEELQGPNGLARIFNEADGSGVQFQNADGTQSFVGVNDGGANGITGQIYSVDKNNGNLGTRINLTNDGFYYFTGKTGATQYTEADEIATKGDIENALDNVLIIDGNV